MFWRNMQVVTQDLDLCGAKRATFKSTAASRSSFDDLTWIVINQEYYTYGCRILKQAVSSDMCGGFCKLWFALYSSGWYWRIGTIPWGLGRSSFWRNRCVPQRAFPIRSWGESCGLWLFQIWCIPERVGLKVQKQNAPLSYSEDNEGVADAAYEDEALEAPADELSWCCRRQKVIVHGRTESFDAVIEAMKEGVTKACKDPRIIKHEVIRCLPKRCIGDLKRMGRARDVKLHWSEADTIRLWKDFLKMWWT